MDIQSLTQVDQAQRHFLPQDYAVHDWAGLKPYFDRLLNRSLHSKADLLTWLKHYDELAAVVQEELGWRFIRTAIDTQDEAAQQAYTYFVENINPQLEEYNYKLQQKYYNSPFRSELTDEAFQIHDQLVARDIELFRQENVPLNSQIELKAQEYSSILGQMTIEHEGETYTLQQAQAFLQRQDRQERERVWRKVTDRRLQDRKRLHQLLDELIELRQQVAHNADYSNFADYKFRELGRLDYTQADVERFHQAIEQEVRPVYEEMLEHRRQQLGVERLRPWDLAVDPSGKPPLKPFETGEELVQQTIRILRRLKPELGEMVGQMQQMQHLDLSSRVGKAPGGFNYPLNETGVPFIFMNAAGMHMDLTTMLHESGHAIHAFLTNDHEYHFFQDVPSEIAELAAMAMELMAMDAYDEAYDDPEAIRRAQIQQLERGVGVLPWIASIDAFQHWLYNNPGHTHEAREEAWVQILQRFMGNKVDYSGLATVQANLWQRQLHIFEVPFYYIEYGMAQLGAFQVWRNFKQHPERGLEQYLQGLRLGYTRSIGTTYATAGADFDFSQDKLREVMNFVRDRHRALQTAPLS